MYGYAAKNRSVAVLLLPLIIGSGIVASGIMAAPVQAQTMVSTTICRNSSTVTISSPQSDSVVTSPFVTLSGTVAQAGQIEVYIDGVFDSVVPLSVAQTTFQTSVQLSTGTHTIKLVAIDSCESTNGETTMVLTYTPLTTGGSSGTTTPTEVDGGVMIDSSGAPAVEQQSAFTLLPAPFQEAIDGLFAWLNIAPADVSDAGLSRFSVWRAVTMTAGVYLAVIGAAQWAVAGLANLPFFPQLEKAPGSRRLQIKRGLRIVGVGLIIIAFIV